MLVASGCCANLGNFPLLSRSYEYGAFEHTLKFSKLEPQLEDWLKTFLCTPTSQSDELKYASINTTHQVRLVMFAYS